MGATDVVGDEADVAIRDASSFEILYGAMGVVVPVEQPCEGLGHDTSLL